MYVTIGGSLNISLGNNPAFLEGHFVRVEPLEVIIMPAWLPLLSACNLHCLTPLFFASYFSLGSFIALERQSLEYSVNMLTTGILYCYAAAGPGCLINCCKLRCFLSRKLNEVQYKLKMYLLLLFRLYFIQTVEQAASPTTKKTKPE